MDIGSGASGPLQNYVPLPELDAIFLSHLHPDHCVDMWGVFVALKYDPSGATFKRMPLFGPPNTLTRLGEILGYPVEALTELFDFTPWCVGQPVQVGPFTVTPYEALHPIEAYSLRVQGTRADGQVCTLCYSGDTDDCEGVRQAASGVDVFLAEASFQAHTTATRGVHLTGGRSGEIASAVGAQKLVLTHIPPTNDPQISFKEAQQTYTGLIEMAQPGAKYTI